MYSKLDYETINPVMIMNLLKFKKDKERIDKILKLNIFLVKDWKLVIPSYPCIKTKDWKQFKKYFPFMHQIFYFALQEMKDLDFAITEVKRILQWEKQYLFPNGTLISLYK